MQKLKRLFPLKKRGDMGNCAGSGQTPDRPGKEKRLSRTSKALTEEISTRVDTPKPVLRVLVEIRYLSAEEGALRWKPVLDGLVPLLVYCTQEADVHVTSKYKLEATGVDGRSFEALLKFPGTRLRKSSKNFVQWKDDDNGNAWGLNFMNESDTDSFLKSCSPPSLSPKSNELHYNLSLSIPTPSPPLTPAQHSESTNFISNNEYTTTENSPTRSEGDKYEHSCQETAHEDEIACHFEVPIEVPDSLAEMPGSLSTEGFSERSLCSIQSEGDVSSGSETLELFQPSSPFKVTEEFILPDIIEENEEAEVDPGSDNTSIDKSDVLSLHSSLDDGELNIKETSFNSEHLFNSTNHLPGEPPQPDEFTPDLDPPTLPMSPPPGPLLSPTLPVSPPPGPFLQPENTAAPSSVKKYNPKNFRRSIAGALEDLPPPLPMTQPPGKLISPRHSSGFLDLAELSADTKKSHLDMNQLVLKMNRVCEASGHEPMEGSSVSERNKKGSPVSHKATLSVITDDVLTLVPPIQDQPDDEGDTALSRQRLGSYHLKTFEPPKEFSDSGFQDTDTAAAPQGSEDIAMRHLTSISSSGDRSPGIMVTSSKDGALAGVSDEQLTENSGSIEVKTFASSGSEISAFNEVNDENGEVETESSIKIERKEDMTEHIAEQVDPSTLLMSIIRKTGWLEMKTVLVCKNRKVAPKSQRKWKKYWANLKRSTLFLYECDEQSALLELETMHSDLKLDLENCIAHAVHEYVKRDNLFCLSTSSGNTYYMQTTSQSEVEDWITCIHCAAAVACTQKDRDQSVPVLMEKMEGLKRKIEKENQLKNLTSLNLTATEGSMAKSMAAEKLLECSENLEAYRVELYRIRCYIASLQGMELPNPYSLLGSISKPTKSLLGKIGIFSVASLHAIVSARHTMHSSVSTTSLHVPKSKIRQKFSTMPRSPAGVKKRKGSLDISGPYPNISSLAWGKSKSSSLPAGIKSSVSLRSFEISGPFPKLSPGKSMNLPQPRKMSLDMDLTSQSSADGTPRSKRAVEISVPISPRSHAGLVKSPTPLHSDQDERTGNETEDNAADVFPEWPFSLVNVINVRIPSAKHEGEIVKVTLRNDMTAEELLINMCEQFKLNITDHFVRLKVMREDGLISVIPEGTDILMEQQCAEIQICQKSLKTVSLQMKEGEDSFGLFLVPEWDVNTEIDLQSVIVKEVKEGGVAESKGIRRGDEVALIEDKSVMELGWVEVERLMSGQEVNLTLRTCLVDAPLFHVSSGRIMDSLICPAPPINHAELSGEMLQSLVVPTPSVDSSLVQEDGSETSGLSRDNIELLLRDTNEISRLIRKWQSQQTEEVKVPWTKDDKLRKSISDLIESEMDYVRLMNVLVERYFGPLRHENYLNQQEVESIIGNIVEIVHMQNFFLTGLKEIWKVELDMSDTKSSLKQIVMKVAVLFQKHMEHFKCYRAFCASHQIVKELLATGENGALINYFKIRNPTPDLSLNVDSLLAKPIVRISRYPLFMSAMLDHMTKDSEESLHLKDVIKQMGVVADHINEMQRLCEMYWPMMHSLFNDPKLHEIGVALRITELEYYGDVTWLNPSIDGLARNWKKGQGPRITMFIFKSSVVLICLEKKHKRKESRGTHEIRVEAEDTKYKQVLPTVRCAVNNLPDSDGVTNMWRLQHRCKGHTGIYFFRSNTAEEKIQATDMIHRSVLEQQRLYGASPSLARTTSPTVLQGSPYQLQRNWRMTSPTPSNLSTSTQGYGTASDTDHD